MRIALVTPYSWTYEGGVNRHTQALAEQLIARGHEVRVLAPWDPPGRLSRTLHRGAAPRERPLPDYLCPLGRTIGIPANGAVSNLCLLPDAVIAMRRELRRGGYDVAHVQEPSAPALAWDACSHRGAPVIGTFHAYSTKARPNHIASLIGARRKFNQLHTRIAVSEAAAWTGRRWFGGRYEVIPNGVDLDAAPDPSGRRNGHDGELRVLFVGRPEERKGLPVLLSAFEAVGEHEPVRLTLVGVTAAEARRHLADPELLGRIDARGSVSRNQLWAELAGTDVLCAPSLNGESFGMVLTEAFAASTPVIASSIAGYSEVVRDGIDGILVPPGDPQRLAEELQRLQHEPARVAAMGQAARERAGQYAWPRVAARVEAVYERAVDASGPADSREQLGRWVGLLPADGGARVPARRLARLDPAPPAAESRRRRAARRVGVAITGAIGVGLAYLAAQRIGLENAWQSAVDSNFTWVGLATGLMMLSLFFRAGAWTAIARAAMPDRSSRLRRRDFTSATMIGVLMSATLPARLGEPARAMIIARRAGRVRESLPVVVGTLVSQTALNILALAILGGIIIASTDLFHRDSEQLFVISLVPALLLVAVLVGPTVVRGANGSGRLARGAALLREALLKVRSGLAVFRDPRRGPIAATAQLIAWAIQVAACYALAVAMGLDPLIGIGGAAAVLFAVNVTAVVPATPSNIGIFQLAVISVLTTGYGVGAADALAFGVILQAVEIATALALGVPALLREGMSWSDVRMSAMSSRRVRIEPRTDSG